MIAIAGGKGGCGKTTTTVALARALADRGGATPLVADADWDMPNLHALAGAGPSPSIAAVRDGDRPDAIAQFVGEPAIGVLPAPTGEESPRVDATFAALRERTARSPVLVDCPAGAGRDAARPLGLADGVVLVSTATPDSLRDAAKTAAMADALGTPILGAALTAAGSIPPGARRLLGTEQLVPVPESSSPLDDAAVRQAFADLADEIPVSPPNGTNIGVQRRLHSHDGY
ncbi:septum site-determining protein MinD [Natronoarchaeum philippinense]|uniref:Septum site-determining protein MinD n=1 Tax=Natronoarchaeum philippinense TaxID=558529 RepID=A0A285N9Z8_NATPI|nr:P-loop NTPase [Natronoarchaeum philippinense]SNZ06259.1 septum site-determining protein MinD [Natronoarchaeum philippinense]